MKKRGLRQKAKKAPRRVHHLLAVMRGKATKRFSTDEIMVLTRDK